MNAQLFESAVIPIFCHSSPDTTEHIGSGVLLTIQPNSHWLCTACHVIAHRRRGAIYLGSAPLLRFSGMLLSTSEPGSDEAQKDPDDLALIQLSAEEGQAAWASGCRFLPSDELELGTGPVGTATAVAVGHYANAVSIDHVSRTAFSTPLVITSTCLSAEKLGAIGLHRENQIGVRYVGRPYDALGRQLRQRPDPHGMSGGGIWTEVAGKRRLAGIITEFYASRSLFIGTRLWRFLPLLGKVLGGRGREDDSPTNS